MTSAATTTYTSLDKNKVVAAEFQRLRLWNGLIGAVFLVVSVVLLALTLAQSGGTVTLRSVSWVRNREPEVGFWLRSTDLFTFEVGYLSVAFTLLAAVDHLYVCSPWGRKPYEEGLLRGSNAYRWTEYFFSAAVMNVMIAILCGVLDISLLAALFALTATCMFFGYVGEVIGREHAVAAFAMGCVPYAATWAVIAAAFCVGARESGAPDFVYAIIVVLFVVESAFGVNQVWPLWRWGLPELRREKGFILLSPTSKMLLAWITYGGIRSMR